jgi:C4-dicarboxylate-specific signal transduction histidine kinase
MASLAELAGSVAQEINSPIHLIQDKISLIKKATLSENKNPTVVAEENDTIQKIIEKVSKVTRGFLIFARDGQSDPVAPVDLQTVVENSIEMLKQKFTKKQIVFRNIHLPPHKITGRESQVYQVVYSLLTTIYDRLCKQSLSSIQPTSEKKPATLWIDISVAEENGNVHLSFIDSAPKYNQEHIQQLLDPQSSTVKVQRDAGLGLLLSKKIIEEHHGHLEYNLEHPDSKFTVQWPAAPATESAADAAA